MAYYTVFVYYYHFIILFTESLLVDLPHHQYLPPNLSLSMSARASVAHLIHFSFWEKYPSIHSFNRSN